MKCSQHRTSQASTLPLWEPNNPNSDLGHMLQEVLTVTFYSGPLPVHRVENSLVYLWLSFRPLEARSSSQLPLTPRVHHVLPHRLPLVRDIGSAQLQAEAVDSENVALDLLVETSDESDNCKKRARLMHGERLKVLQR